MKKITSITILLILLGSNAFSENKESPYVPHDSEIVIYTTESILGSRWHITHTFLMNKKAFQESLTQDVDIGALELSLEDAIKLGRQNIIKGRDFLPGSEKLVTAELIVKAFPGLDNGAKEELKKFYFYYVYFSYFNQPINGVDQAVHARMVILPDGTRLWPSASQQQLITSPTRQ